MASGTLAAPFRLLTVGRASQSARVSHPRGDLDDVTLARGDRRFKRALAGIHCRTDRPASRTATARAAPAYRSRVRPVDRPVARPSPMARRARAPVRTRAAPATTPAPARPVARRPAPAQADRFLLCGDQPTRCRHRPVAVPGQWRISSIPAGVLARQLPKQIQPLHTRTDQTSRKLRQARGSLCKLPKCRG